MGEVDPVHVCMARGEYLVHRSWRMITWNHFFSAPFITPGLVGFGSRVEGLGWVYFYMHIAASGLLACIMLLCYIGSDCWPYNSFKWSEIWWVNSNRAHFKCSPGICLSAPGATLMLFSQSSDDTGMAPSNTAISWQIPTFLIRRFLLSFSNPGTSWLQSQLLGQVAFETSEHWFSGNGLQQFLTN